MLYDKAGASGINDLNYDFPPQFCSLPDFI